MSSTPQRILFITSNSIGDAILSTGLLRHLVETCPDARFTVACGPAPSELFRAVPRLDKLIVMRKRSWKRHWFAMWRSCIGTQWDVIVDLRNSIFSRLLMRRRLACLTSASGGHKVIDNARVLSLAAPPAPRIWLDAQAEAEADRLMGAALAPAVLALAPAANWPPKQWPIEHFIKLAEKLTASDGPLPNARVLVAAAPHEREMAAPLLSALPPDRLIDTIGTDLPAVAACFRRCRLFVGNDSGLMHLSAAIGIPTLGLFGPGYEHVYGPWGANSRYVRTPEDRETLLAQITSPNAPNLMKTLQVETVADAADALLRDKPA